MTDFGTDFDGDVAKVVDDESDVGCAGDWQNLVGDSTDFISARRLGAQLDKVGAASAELARHLSRHATVKVGGVDKGIEPTLGERFHRLKVYLAVSRCISAYLPVLTKFSETCQNCDSEVGQLLRTCLLTPKRSFLRGGG